MNDLISREDLRKCAIPCQIHNGALTDLCVPLYQIDNAPTVEYPFYQEAYQTGYEEGKNERPQDKWIPVSKRLPERANESYLVTVDYEGLIFSCQRFFFGEGLGWNDDSVIAWQPLPEPYQKGR